MPASLQTQQDLLRRMQFVLVENGQYVAEWTFLIPPESYEQSEPVRANIQRTAAGGYADLYGADLPTFTLEGTTGYEIRRVIGGQEMDGYQYWLDFLQTIYHAFINQPVDRPDIQYELHLYNWTHQQYYSIMPTVVTWDMAVPENTVFYYDIVATGLSPLLRPNPSFAGSSYNDLVTNGAQYLQSRAQEGALHGAQSQILLGGG